MVKLVSRSSRAVLSGFAILSLLTMPVSAQARGFTLIVDAQISQMLLLLLGSGSSCVNFSYDKNGNRTAQSVSTIGSGQTLWGSGSFGCFVWSQ